MIFTIAAIGAGAIAGAIGAFAAISAYLRMVDRPSRLHRLVGRFVPALPTLVQSRRDWEERYRILSDNIAAAIVIQEASGGISWVSPFTEVLTGYSRHEIYGRRDSFLRDIVVEEDKGIFERALAIAGQGEAFQCRYRFQHRSGLVMWAETRSVPVYDDVSRAYVVLSVTIDVTSAVLQQRQLEEKNRDLHEFTYMVSHDLKGPINTIKGMLGVVAEDRALPEGTREPLEHIGKATRRLEQLVTGILKLARVTSQTVKLEPVQLEQVVAEIAGEFHSDLLNADAKIVKIHELPVVLGDQVQLYQVLTNLIGNALKYRSSERPLVVSISCIPGSTSRKATVVVEDNGTGIDPASLGAVFKPFHRLDSKEEGFGVGLATVQRLVEKLGGEIRVSSDGRTGTRFEIELRKA